LNQLHSIVRTIIAAVGTTAFAASVYARLVHGVPIHVGVIILMGFIAGYYFAEDIELSTPAFSLTASESEKNDES